MKEEKSRNWPFYVALGLLALLFLQIFIQQQMRANEEFARQTDLAITRYERELNRKYWSITGGN